MAIGIESCPQAVFLCKSAEPLDVFDLLFPVAANPPAHVGQLQVVEQCQIALPGEAIIIPLRAIADHQELGIVVVPDQPQHLLLQCKADAQHSQFEGQVCTAALSMTGGNDPAPTLALRLPGHQRLGNIVQQRPQHQHQPLFRRQGFPATVDLTIDLLQHHRGMHPYIAFLMPGWVLGSTLQFVQQREKITPALQEFLKPRLFSGEDQFDQSVHVIYPLPIAHRFSQIRQIFADKALLH